MKAYRTLENNVRRYEKEIENKNDLYKGASSTAVMRHDGASSGFQI